MNNMRVRVHDSRVSEAAAPQVSGVGLDLEDVLEPVVRMKPYVTQVE